MLLDQLHADRFLQAAQAPADRPGCEVELPPSVKRALDGTPLAGTPAPGRKSRLFFLSPPANPWLRRLQLPSRDDSAPSRRVRRRRAAPAWSMLLCSGLVFLARTGGFVHHGARILGNVPRLG